MSFSFDEFISNENEEDIDLTREEVGDEYFEERKVFEDWSFQGIAADRFWQSLDRGFKCPLIVSPTGSGKTRMAGIILQEAIKKRGMRCAFTVDRLILLEQARITFESMGIRCGMVIANQPTDSRAEIQLISKDTFNARYVNKNGSLVSRSVVRDLDFIIHDEAHRSTNSSHTNLRNMFPEAIVLGLTATPILPSGKPLGVPFFDTMIEAARPSKLLEDGHILPATVWVPDRPDFTDAKGKSKYSDFNKEKVLAEMRRDNIVGSSILNWKKHANNSQTLVFCVDRKHAKWNSRNYNSKGIPSLYVGCEMKMNERRSIFKKFQSGDVKCLHSSDLLTEGVDFPWVECLQILKPTRSLRLWLQMIGRGMRKHTFPDGRVKKEFVLIDHTGGVIAHCAPGDDIPWNLGTQRAEELLKEEKEKNPTMLNKVCPQCAFLQPVGRSECPNCGYVYRELVDFQEIEAKEGKLVKLKESSEKLPQMATPDEVKEFIQKKRVVEWIKALRTAKKNNTTWGAAAAMFSNQCGLTPWEAGMSPLAPGSNWKAKINNTPDLIP